jgi:predicted acetyltransferase
MVSAEEKNLASRKTIERCGGQHENTVEAQGKMICRYWIDLDHET